MSLALVLLPSGGVDASAAERIGVILSRTYDFVHYCGSPQQLADKVTSADVSDNPLEKLAAVFVVITSAEAQTPVGDLQKQLYQRDLLYWLQTQWSEQEILESLGARSGLSACDRLSQKMHETVYPGQEEEYITGAVRTFVVEALAENVSDRTGKMRRFVAVMSGNAWKLHEYRRFFGQYGIEVLQLPKGVEQNNFLLRALLRDTKTATCVPLCVFRETSRVLRPQQPFPIKAGEPSEQLSAMSSMRHGVMAMNETRMKWFRWNGTNIEYHEEVHVTQGRIDLNKRQRSSANLGSIPTFGWDDVFVLDRVDMSFHELAQHDLKVSSREMVLSSLARKLIHYRQSRNLQHTPLVLERPVDFRQTVQAFVSQHSLLKLPTVQASGMGALLKRVLTQGVFFRGADNRRQGNYWLPSLNAGLPLVAKKDHIHELTYMLHDIGHMRMPDLVPTHDPTQMPSKDARELERLYIVYRMMSEAITLVLADYVFVDALVRGRSQLPIEFRDYDFGARRIWPLFDALKRPVDDFSLPLHERVLNLQALLYANVRFVLCGDEAPFHQLISQSAIQAGQAYRDMGESAHAVAVAKRTAQQHLDAYRNKYVPFFAEDYRWTIRNYSHMASHGKDLSAWWKSTKEVRDVLLVSSDSASLPIESVSDYHAALGHFEATQNLKSKRPSDDLVDRVFDFVFARDIAPCVFPALSTVDVRKPLLSSSNSSKPDLLAPIKRAFARYLAGQMMLFTRFNLPAISSSLDVFRSRLLEQFRSAQAAPTQEQLFQEIDMCRQVYEETLSFLLECSLVSLDDVATFKEVLPLFPAFFVSYDQVDSSDPACLRAFWQKITC